MVVVVVIKMYGAHDEKKFKGSCGSHNGGGGTKICIAHDDKKIKRKLWCHNGGGSGHKHLYSDHGDNEKKLKGSCHNGGARNIKEEAVKVAVVVRRVN